MGILDGFMELMRFWIFIIFRIQNLMFADLIFLFFFLNIIQLKRNVTILFRCISGVFKGLGNSIICKIEFAEYTCNFKYYRFCDFARPLIYFLRDILSIFNAFDRVGF